MQNQPLISIIIDNYNYARFLPDAINSALNQDYQNYEIIVVDDASTDHSRELITSYGDKIKTIFIEKNAGQGSAFNAGFAESRGDIICFLDSDDVFFKNKLSTIAKAATENPCAVMIYHCGYMVDKNLQKIDTIFPKKLWSGDMRKTILKTSESLFPPTSFLAFRREFLQTIFPLNPFLTRIDADFPLQMLAGILGKVAVIKEPLGYYRLHGDNWFSNNDFVRLNLKTLHSLMRRTEKAFYYINVKLAEQNAPGRIHLTKHRFHRRNLFIFKHLGWREFLIDSFTNPNFLHLFDRLAYISFGIRRRLEFHNNPSIIT